jgi:8-amino-7-oxononanoate synthase
MDIQSGWLPLFGVFCRTMNRNLERLQKELQELKEISRFRNLKKIDYKEGASIGIDGRNYMNCASNDYLGVASDNDLKKEFLDLCAKNPLSFETDLSSSSSRSLSGNSGLYDKLEEKISSMYGRESSLIFSSGYHLNSGFFEAVYKKGDLILADKLVHASIIDGIRLSRATHLRYRHLDYDHLRTILKKERGKHRSVVIVSESVFSMDGDLADIKALSDIAKEFDAELFIDEAHAVNCIGKKGLGVCETSKTISDIDFIAGTFGKGFGGVGAFIVCDRTVKEYLINKCRSLIFTTALPPLIVNWIDFVTDRCSDMNNRRILLEKNSSLLRKIIKEAGFISEGKSHIVPLMCKEDAAAVNLSENMLRNGIFVPSIRPPTVPEGSSRLRFSVTATLTNEASFLIKKAFKETTG